MAFVCDGGECEFREGLCDTDYGFELSDGYGDGTAEVGGLFGFGDAVADRDEVRGEFLSGFAGEAWGAAAVEGKMLVICCSGWGCAYGM